MRVVTSGRALKLAVTSRTTGRKPASYGRFKRSNAETRVNRAFAGRCSGNPYSTRVPGLAGEARFTLARGVTIKRNAERQARQALEPMRQGC